MNRSPSVIATSALVSAIHAVLPHHVTTAGLTAKAEEVTGIPGSQIQACVVDIADMVSNSETGLKLGFSHSGTPAVAIKHTMAHKSVMCNNNTTHQQNATPETPTDVQDVLF